MHMPDKLPTDAFESRILNHLTGMRSNFSFGLKFWGILRDPNIAPIVRQHRIIVKTDGIYAIPPNQSLFIPEGEQFYELLLAGPKEDNLEHAANEFVKLQLRVFTTETFEKIKTYCRGTNTLSDLKQQPWFHFARLVRNGLNHDQHWLFRTYDRSLLPITWNRKTIDESMEGQEMTWSFYDPFVALELWDEIYEFARTLPGLPD